MSRSQRRLRTYRGFDESGATAYMRGDFTSPPLTQKQQRDAALLRRGASSRPTPANTVLPTTTGTLTVAQTQSRTTGTWEGVSGPVFTQQWFRRGAANGVGVAIPGATGTSYNLAAADVGFFIGCRVTATDTNGANSVFTLFRGPVA